MRIRRAFINYFIQVEEATRRYAGFAEGIEAVAAIVGEEP